jgi:acetoin utilization deacetylase AcuC-like enzyme
MHPESPQRLTAMSHAIDRADIREAITLVEAPLAPLEVLAAVHTDELVSMIQRVSARGGGRIDADTVAAPASFDAARYAAGAGLESIDRLSRGEADTAFCVVRPPGHHATKVESMGFCLFNNVAVAATALADAGERVLIVDYDAHHGNGTQDIFYRDPRVLFVSFHQWPCYPGTGRIDETGAGDAIGSTVNVPLPPGATGDVYAQAWDRHVAPQIDAFAPTWLLLSAGFDAHRADPITDMGLTAGDYAALTSRVLKTAPPGRRIVFLEGGYDLDALTETGAAVMATLVDQAFETERQTNGGPGIEIVDMAVKHFATFT